MTGERNDPYRTELEIARWQTSEQLERSQVRARDHLEEAMRFVELLGVAAGVAKVLGVGDQDIVRAETTAKQLVESLEHELRAVADVRAERHGGSAARHERASSEGPELQAVEDMVVERCRSCAARLERRPRESRELQTDRAVSARHDPRGSAEEAVSQLGPRTRPPALNRASLVLPHLLVEPVLGCLARFSCFLVKWRVAPSAVTVLSLVLAGVGAVFVAVGELGWGAGAMALASLGDALDGMVARRAGRASLAGALLDAAVDRYEEIAFVGGVAIYLRQSVASLVLCFGTIAGSYMISYGSAKAESMHVAVPSSPMRRAERAILLCAGAGLSAVAGIASRAGFLNDRFADAPMLACLFVITIAANGSAVHRLWAIAKSATDASIARRALDGGQHCEQKP